MMAAIWQPQEISVYKSWVETIINEASDSLNDWETNFIENIENQLDRNRNLTEAQAEKLESIYASKTS
jgi:hypothetical protein